MDGITALVLTYNEEKRIKDILNSLKDFDDIIVYDKSSSDATREIAKECGAKILKVPYYNDTPPSEVLSMIKEALFCMQDNEWILSIVASDIVHYDLYAEMKRCIEHLEEAVGVIEVPIFRYSMGIRGKNTFYPAISFKKKLFRRELHPEKSTVIHESPFQDTSSVRLKCRNPQAAIYHLTHENLELVMDRHWRYAKQYVDDKVGCGKDRIQIMKYSWHECVRVVWRFFSKGVFTKKWTGLAQCMMLVMYNTMIYLNAYFSDEKEDEIRQIYNQMKEFCMDKREKSNDIKKEA